MSYPNDPFYLFGRDGTKDNPYKQYNEPLTIFNGKVILTEFPNKHNHVVVKDGSTVYGEVYSQDALTTDNNFFVDYDSGSVYFDLSHSGKQLTFTYTGTGYFAIPTTRVYTQTTNGVPTQDLQDMIDNYNQLNGTDLYNLFDPQTGHKHTGSAGDAPPIDSLYITHNPGMGTISNAKDSFDYLFTNRLPIVSITEYGAVADYNPTTNDGTDNAPFIQDALNDMSSKGGGYVIIPIGGFAIKTEITIPENVKLIGTREGLNQGAGTNTSNGGNRIRMTGIEPVLFMLPSNIIQIPIIMNRNSNLSGIGIVYPNQDPTTTTESNIIQYATTISATNGCQISNLRVWGAYHFISASGESIYIYNIYGYTCGKAISITNSDDVCLIENIHLNPNVARPVQGFIDLAQARTDSVAIYLNNCDGVQLQNIHVYGYRTDIQSVGSTGSNQCTFTIDNFFFDGSGLAFDIDSDSFWGVKASNGTIVMGLSNDPNYAGLLRLNKSLGSNTQIVPILFTNITVNKHASAPAIPTYLINFIYPYSFDLRLNNISTDASTPIISSHSSYVEGKVRSGNGQVDLARMWQTKNWVRNKDLILDSNSDGVPDNWTVNVGSGTTLTVTQSSSTGFMHVSTNTGIDGVHGLYQRIDLGSSQKVSIMLKVRNPNSTGQLYVNAYDSGYANPLAMSATFDAFGYARVTYSSTSKQIYDVYISPGTSANDGVDVEYVQLTNGTRTYIAD